MATVNSWLLQCAHNHIAKAPEEAAAGDGSAADEAGGEEAGGSQHNAPMAEVLFASKVQLAVLVFVFATPGQ